VAGRPPAQTSAQVRYIGYAKNIEDAYRAADFTVLASKYEPFGLVGIESVMCGTPVIFPTSVGCCSAIADDAKFTFQPGDADGLRHAVRRALDAKNTNVTAASILYDTSIAAHIASLLTLAEGVAADLPVSASGSVQRA
jgi:glycosyltransferase involved in cell wall biosynthesis